jgi:hypothetical protein
VVRLGLSWEALAARALRLALAQLLLQECFGRRMPWAAASKRFGLSACGARAAGGGGRSHWRASAVFVLFGSAVCCTRRIALSPSRQVR